jgi:hypothetical protein
LEGRTLPDDPALVNNSAGEHATCLSQQGP